MDTKEIKLKIPKANELELYFYDDIDEFAESGFNKSIIKLANEYQALINENTAICKQYSITPYSNYKSVTINLSTYGGSVYKGLSIYNTIKQINDSSNFSFDMQIKASGMVASMGIILLLSLPLEKRIAYKNTTFLIHQVSTFALGQLKGVEDTVDEAKRLNTVLFQIIEDNSKITKEQLEKIYIEKTDWILTAEEALELGLISAII